MKRIKKVENDKFYTKDKVAERYISYIKNQGWFSEIKKIIEPSAGSGAFSDKIENCIAYDIYPERDGIIQQNFLTLEISYEEGILVIGNPPFGKQSSLAIQFIRKSAIFADYIAFILPISFKKVSMKNKIPLTHSLIFEEKLPKDSFIFPNGSDYDVPCIFQIWKRQPREKIKVMKTCKYFNFVKKEIADIAIRRVGFYSGTIKENIGELSEESHYFLKLNMDMCDFKNKFSSIDWCKYTDNSTGPKSLSKHEIISEFINIYS